MKELPFDPYDFFGYVASGLVLVVVSQLTLGFPNVFGADLKPFDVAVTILGVYILGQIVAGPAKSFLEDLLAKKILGSPTQNLLHPTRRRIAKRIFPGYYTPLPPGIRVKLAVKIADSTSDHSDSESIFLSIRYAPEVLTSETLISKLNTFRDQYGFARNVSFSLLFAALSFALEGHLKGSAKLTHFSAAAFGAGLFLLYRFLKFYRQYSYELFNAYAHMTEKGTP
jgi:hypothetical protein